MPLLDVEDLTVEFPTRRGVLRALDRVSFSIDAGEILGVVGESGAGKSLTGAPSSGCWNGRAASPAAKSGWTGSVSTTWPPEPLRRIRGRRIGMIFQDPLTTLNPLYTIGRQLTETMQTHAACPTPRRGARRSAGSTGSAFPPPPSGSMPTRTSSPAASGSAW